MQGYGGVKQFLESTLFNLCPLLQICRHSGHIHITGKIFQNLREEGSAVHTDNGHHTVRKRNFSAAGKVLCRTMHMVFFACVNLFDARPDFLVNTIDFHNVTSL